MNVNAVDYIFNEISLLPNQDKEQLFLRMKKELYPYEDKKTVAYTVSGLPLTKEQYQKRIVESIKQYRDGKYTTLEQLSNDLGYKYDD